MQGLVKVRLLGELGRIFGREWDLLIRTPAEAIAAIAANVGDQFIRYLYQSEESGIAYRVVTSLPLGIDSSELDFPCDRLIIAPIVSGRGGVGKVLLGGALLVGSFFMPATIGLLGATISSTTVGLLGGALLIGGIHQMLSPVPKTPKRGEIERRDSFLFDSASDLGYQGLPVPVGYGRRMVTDLPIVSIGISVEEVPV